jgi:acetyl-CoA carboxylase biotin carboxyl carrier protein
MSLTHEDVLAILKIIDETPYDEVRLEIGDLKIHLRRRGDGSLPDPEPTQSRAPENRESTATEPQAAVQAPPQLAEGLVAVHAPMLGTFYRAPAPGERPFVEVGDKVGAGDTVCLVEVMKLFHSVKAGVAGTVVKICVENGSMVEHGQALILIETDRHAADAAVQ